MPVLESAEKGNKTMGYTPESDSGECAWCGEAIEWWNDGAEPEPRPAWVTVGQASAECFDGSAHVPTFDVVCQRAGSSNRTADELAAVFIIDTAALIDNDNKGGGFDVLRIIEGEVHSSLSESQREDIAMAEKVEGWMDDPDDSQALSDACRVWESYLADAGYGVEWDDGYTIFRVVTD